jgi:KDO2-lipid IV(A) lauroyltransferase
MSKRPRNKTLQRFKNDLYFLLSRGLFAFARAIPLAVGLKIGPPLSRLFWWLLPRERRRCLLHLKTAFPEWTDAERLAIAKETFRNLGRSFFELFHFDELLATVHTEHPYVQFEGAEHVKKAFSAGRGGIFFTGHLGNWELMAAWFVAFTGCPGNEIVRKIYDPRFDKLLNEHRGRHKYKPLTRGGAELVEDIIRVLSNNEMLGLLIDQDTKVRGVFADWFGHPAWTPSGPAYLCYQANLDIMMMTIHRNPGGGHTVTISEPLPRPQSGDLKADVLAYTQMMNDRITAHIRSHPTEWVWMHRRWKTRPPDESPEKTPAPEPLKKYRLRRLAAALVAKIVRPWSWEAADKIGAALGRARVNYARHALMDGRFFRERTTLIGRDKLDAALAARKGAILLVGRTFEADLATWALAALGYPVDLIARPPANEFLDLRLAWARRTHGVRPWRQADADEAAAHALSQGGVLAIGVEPAIGPRAPAPGGASADAPRPLSALPAAMAAKYGCPVLHLTTQRAGAGRFEVVVDDPVAYATEPPAA